LQLLRSKAGFTVFLCDQFGGLAGWTRDEHYDINAKLNTTADRAWQSGRPAIALRSLLAGAFSNSSFTAKTASFQCCPRDARSDQKPGPMLSHRPALVASGVCGMHGTKGQLEVGPDDGGLAKTLSSNRQHRTRCDRRTGLTGNWTSR